MRLSQLTKVMNRNDRITVMLSAAPVDQMCLYDGMIRGIYRDNPINRGHITTLLAYDNVVIVEIKLAEGEGK